MRYPIIVAALLAATAAGAQPAPDCDEFVDYDKAIAACTALIRQNPNNAKAYYIRGSQHDQMAMAIVLSNDRSKNAPALYDRAFADLSKAIELNPGYLDAYWARARVRQGRSESFQAQTADYDRAVRAAPDNPEVYSSRAYHYGLAAAKQGANLYDLAIADYNKALSLKPRSANLLAQRGSMYHSRGDCATAVKDYSAAIAIDVADNPTTPKGSMWFWSVRAECYVTLGDKARAIADFRKVLEIDPDDTDAQDGLKQLGVPAR